MFNRYGEPIFQFRLAHLFLAVFLVAVASSLHHAPWLAAGAVALIVLGYLHYQSLGRTTPLAAFIGILSAVLAGFPVGLFLAMKEAQQRGKANPITEDDILAFCVADVCFGLTVAALVAVFVAIERRDEWFNHLR